MLVFVYDLYSESSKERRANFNNREGLAVEGLVCSKRSPSMVRDNDLCFSGRVVDLHSVCSEACCYRFQGFSNLGEELVGCVREDGYCEVIEKTGIGSLAEPSGGCWWKVCCGPKGMLGRKSKSSSRFATIFNTRWKAKANTASA